MHGDADPLASISRSAATPGSRAVAWALLKSAVSILGLPISIPALMVSLRQSAKVTAKRIQDYPAHLHAIAEGRPSPLPAQRTLRLPADRRYLITSDLHRGIPGRLDWPERQGSKSLYPMVLRRYADEGWHLIENGDVEDFWMVGGSAWGAFYDMGILATTAAGPFGEEYKAHLLDEHLGRIVDNNAETYALLRDGFGADGRYHRTVGNHDDLFCHETFVDCLAEHLPGVRVHDTILLDSPGAGPDAGIAGVEAVIAHGHVTDAWNGPGFATMGRAVTWLANGLDDLPRLGRTEGLPDEEALGRILAGRGRNRLITVDPRFGGNRRFDSLDEERLFARLRVEAPDDGWPWIVFGHTHLPMLWPIDAAGARVRYANTGCGVLDSAFSALEWDPSLDDRLRLVLWRNGLAGPERVELVPHGATHRPV